MIQLVSDHEYDQFISKQTRHICPRSIELAQEKVHLPSNNDHEVQNIYKYQVNESERLQEFSSASF